ncbi:hypothetical protein CROQUDRAFT_91203 [Cronartium quercuum f. sp. fusiforme G11]|uniref:Uncharacterized protein n=1 Tax=Cronartium quercuum f. sp. fusiforme G11 TaxID=708437 RepID=A0A9P6NP37_9BASI|nr:hypothetical protein CROQUDRAFT_91203 [Cronartium quercuum f. sp. fusiforme G11]
MYLAPHLHPPGLISAFSLEDLPTFLPFLLVFKLLFYFLASMPNNTFKQTHLLCINACHGT